MGTHDGRTSVTGKEELGALVLTAYQKTLGSPGVDFLTYYGARASEREFLRAFVHSASTAGDRASVERYFSAPVSDMFTQVEAAYTQAFPFLVCAQDRAGIYQRLNAAEKSELIDRVVKDGEVSAYLWAYHSRPDIFQSADFVPQGILAETWKGFIQSRFGVSSR